MLIRKQLTSHLTFDDIFGSFKSIHLNSKEVDKTLQLPKKLSDRFGKATSGGESNNATPYLFIVNRGQQTAGVFLFKN